MACHNNNGIVALNMHRPRSAFLIRQVSTLCLQIALLAGLLFALPSIAATAGSGKSAFLDNTDDESFLPPDEAFKLKVSVQDAQTLLASFQVAPGHYLYRDRIKFESKTTGVGIESVDLPKGELKQDPTFGETTVYHEDLLATIHLTQPAIGVITLAATYQGCSEKGLCYAPIHKTIEVNPRGLVDSNPNAIAKGGVTAVEDNESVALLASGKLWLITAGFFGFGLLLSLTPCVLPMIPILSGIIVGSKQSGAKSLSRLHTFNLSLAYVLGMSLSYTLAGIAAGLSGRLVSNALQNAWVLGAASLVFVLLALSMFGFYELKLPGALENRMATSVNRIKGGRFLGVLMMGALSALIVSPCVAAPLAGALIYISQTHNVMLGGLALFALSLGMGVPLLLIGASAGSLLPKTGHWMVAVRNFFGVLMLGMAIWLISPLLTVAWQMILWAALLIIPAIFMHALDALPVHAGKGLKFWKGVAVIMLLLGVSQIIGALTGAKSPLQPLNALRTGTAASPITTSLPFQRISSVAELENHIQTAAGKTVMLDFYADWCVACKELERNTFSDARVQKALQNAVLLQADVTQNSTADIALLKRFGLFGPPGIIFFDSTGAESKKVIGYQDAEQFLATLNKLKL